MSQIRPPLLESPDVAWSFWWLYPKVLRIKAMRLTMLYLLWGSSSVVHLTLKHLLSLFPPCLLQDQQTVRCRQDLPISPIDMPHSNFIFDTLAFPFSAFQILTLLPLTLYMFTPPSLLPTTGLGTVQFISHSAQYLFQSSPLTAMEMPAAPNCDTFRVLYKYCKNCFLSSLCK